MRTKLCVIVIYSSLSILNLSCPKVETAVEVNPKEPNRLPAILLSELSLSSDSMIHCPIVLSNDTKQVKKVIFIGTGCSCYGVTLDGEPLQKGQELTIDAKQSLELEILAQAPLSESNNAYYATFTFSSDENPQERKLTCDLSVLSDIKIFPKVLTCDTKPGETIEMEKDVTIEHIYRSDNNTSVEPQLLQLPEGVKVTELERVESPVNLEDNLWRATWKAILEIKVDGNLTGEGQSSDFRVAFPATKYAKKLSSRSKLIKRVRLPVRYPSELHFGKFHMGQTRKRSLFISSVDNEFFHLELEPEIPAGDLKVDVPEKAAAQYRVDLTLSPQSSGEWEEVLVFKTDLKDQPRIQVKIRAKVEPVE